MSDFEELFDSLYRRAYQAAYAILGHRQAAEDAAAEALAQTYVRWSRASAHPYGWVTRVSANLALGMLRKQRRSWRSGRWADVAGHETVPERLDLQAALRALPRRQREVVVLRYLADLPEAEVAALLQCSVGTVKQHASRGLTAIRARMDG